MSQIRETTTIQIHPNAMNKRVYASQYDFGSRLVFDFVTVAGGSFYDELENYTVKIQGKKPSGMGFTVGFDPEWENSVIITKEMTDEVGAIPVEIVFTSEDGTELFGSANFEFVVEPSPHPAGTVDGEQEAKDLLARLERAVEEAQEAADNASQAVLDAQRALQDVQAEVTIDDVNPSLTTAFSGTKTVSLLSAANDRMAEVETRADSLESGVESLDTEMTGVKARVSTLETNVDGIGTEISAINDDIDALNEKGYFTFEPPYGTKNTIVKTRPNGVVYVYANIDAIPAGDTSAALIPSEYAPSQVIYGVGLDGGNNARRFALRGDGSITAYTGTATGLYFFATYLRD